VRREIERELSRLRRTNPQSAEYQVLRTYLDLVTELPWGTRTEDKIDLEAAERILDEDHYGLEDVKDRVLEFLAVRKLQMERAAEDALEDSEPVGATPDIEQLGPNASPESATAARESTFEADVPPEPGDGPKVDPATTE